MIAKPLCPTRSTAVCGRAIRAKRMTDSDSPSGTRASLIERVRDPSDKASWLEFDALYRPFLRSIARRFGLSAADADDLVQDVFAKVVGAIRDFELDKERGRFRSWLKTIAVRSLSDRQAVRQRASPLAPQQEPAIADPLEKMWDQEYRQHVLSCAIERVREGSKPLTWACFAECKLKGRRAVEVAAILGLKIDAVHQNVARTMERLRKQCHDYEEEPGISESAQADT
jgi:RNA polymerase sigma factor (sigma-70 family)